ncbi:MAG: radical SAM family heme chaperone HemW [Balneolaceae bacterium]
MSGIYLHIPFCKQACSYCDFYFITRNGLREEFVDRLCEEIDSYRETEFADETVETIYIGGGTPSLLKSAEVERVFGHLHEVFDLEPEEVTMELNPDDVTPSYLRELRSMGINRASMGVQSFDPERLKFMNRAHTPDEAEAALSILRETGFKTFTADLIYACPGQTLQGLEKDLDILLKYDPPHVSAYSLTIEPGTRLGKQAELGRLDLVEDEVEAEHFDLLAHRLGEAGILRYEISNYSKPGFEAVHNTRYWRHTNYLGLGPSAHSFWRDGRQGRRWKVVSDIRQYMTRPFEEVQVEHEPLTLHTLAEERLMLGLRTRWGVALGELMDRYEYSLTDQQVEWLHEKQKENLLELKGGEIRFREAGLKIADHLVVELLTRR